MYTQDTICAISTPHGMGGIAVIRVSGPDAVNVCNRLFRPYRSAHTLSSRNTHTLTFGQIVTPDGETIDEVVLSLFKAPHSFTGEDVVEISCHGSHFIQQRILELLTTSKATNNLQSIEGGCCRLASPGEFTRRAFENGRFDLTQAEAVADLIAAQSAASHRLAMQQMKGSISKKLNDLHAQLLQLTALLELELDFSEEDVEFADRSRLVALSNALDNEVLRLANTFSQGQAIKHGIPVAIIGAPNVGKSTLLNALLKEDRAIVSDIQGTTRDLIEDTITLGGYLFRFIDTAGIRHTQDQIELLGIERSHQAANRARIILLMSEPGVPFPQIDANPNQIVIRIMNKMDDENISPNQNIEPLSYSSEAYLSISAKTGRGIEQLEQLLIDSVSTESSTSDVILTNTRHHEALMNAHDALQRVLQGLSAGISNEFIALDLQDVISALNKILGKEITSQDTLNTIFSQFCIGK